MGIGPAFLSRSIAPCRNCIIGPNEPDICSTRFADYDLLRDPEHFQSMAFFLRQQRHQMRCFAQTQVITHTHTPQAVFAFCKFSS